MEDDEPLVSGTGQVDRSWTDGDLDSWSGLLHRWDGSGRPRALTQLVRKVRQEAHCSIVRPSPPPPPPSLSISISPLSNLSVYKECCSNIVGDCPLTTLHQCSKYQKNLLLSHSFSPHQQHRSITSLYRFSPNQGVPELLRGLVWRMLSGLSVEDEILDHFRLLVTKVYAKRNVIIFNFSKIEYFLNHIGREFPCPKECSSVLYCSLSTR